jgi:hypothetical protein
MKSTRNDNNNAFMTEVFSILNAIVEIYLTTAIKPFLTLHEKFYCKLNAVIRSTLDENSDKIPEWFTANFITYFRTVLVIPCVMLLVNGWVLTSSFFVIFVDFGDFLDGVVARYWIERKKDDSYGKKRISMLFSRSFVVRKTNGV